MARTKSSAGPPGPILVPVDFSQGSEDALVWAARAAECWKRPLLVLHVVHDPEAAPGYYARSKKRKKHLVRMEEVAEEMMDDFLTTARASRSEIAEVSELRTRMVTGLPVQRILEISAEVESPLIVMGSLGRTGLSGLLLGSKAQKVVQLSPVPVTIVKSLESPRKKSKR